jgi:hypothetical protein
VGPAMKHGQVAVLRKAAPAPRREAA